MGTSQPNANSSFNMLEVDRFGGVSIHSENEFHEDVPSFASRLAKSIASWSADREHKAPRVRVIWFHVSRRYSHWVPVLCENAFRFHRASHDGDTVVMCRWLPAPKPSPIPPYAHTMVGVGGIVLNAKRELLVVLQRFGSKESLKFPGGYVEPDEELADAAVREVLEETGVETKFVSCVSFRHTHGQNFGCSDLYFVVRLEPLTVAVNNECDEVLDVQWISIDDFLRHPKVDFLNRLFVETFLKSKQNEISIVKNEVSHPVTQKPFSFYCIENVGSKK